MRHKRCALVTRGQTRALPSVPANPLVTPTHIKPVWYFTPFYAMLRAVPDKLFGVIVMFSAVGILFLVPWLDRSPAKSIRFRGWFTKVLVSLFVVAFVALGWLGLQADRKRTRLNSRH